VADSLPLDLILTQMSDMLFVMTVDSNREFRYARMNPAAMRASGLNEDTYGAVFHDVVVPTEADFLHAQYSRALRLHKPVTFILNHESQIGESILNPIIGQPNYRPHQ